ncbi:hypothetical protein FQR65_LT00022 [Abscondita terminalis]|nr:hypothetical protein FQR65_LT00022 [Abscondita terminalis]
MVTNNPYYECVMRPVQNRAPTGVGAGVENMRHERSLLDTNRPPEVFSQHTFYCKLFFTCIENIAKSLPVIEAQITVTETTATTITSPAESTVQTHSQGQSPEQSESALSEDIANQLGKVFLSKPKLTAKERREKIKQTAKPRALSMTLISKESKNRRRRRAKIQLPNQEPLQFRWETRDNVPKTLTPPMQKPKRNPYERGTSHPHPRKALKVNSISLRCQTDRGSRRPSQRQPD